VKFQNVINPKRQCIRCKVSKPIKGGTTIMGSKFICKDCKEKKNEGP
jgi:hypothetical protein